MRSIILDVGFMYSSSKHGGLSNYFVIRVHHTIYPLVFYARHDMLTHFSSLKSQVCSRCCCACVTEKSEVSNNLNIFLFCAMSQRYAPYALLNGTAYSSTALLPVTEG